MNESGLSERPTRLRTWAPKGQTAVIQFYFNWKHLSAIAGFARTNCLFRFHEGRIKKEQIIDFLKALKAHHGQLLREYFDSLGGHIQIAFLPPYA